VPRYWAARSLVPMLLRYRDHLPLLASHPVPLRATLPVRPVER
jgi:hypothetical protein